MLITVETEIFLSPARVLVNPVNTAGVMSSGVSGEFKRFFPEAFAHYRSLCEAGQFEPGRLFVYRAAQRTIVHLPVKRHWRTAATAQIVEVGLQRLAGAWADLGVHSLAVPRFEEEGLEWESAVKPLLETYLAPLPIPVYVHHQPAGEARRSIKQIDQLLNMPAAAVPFERVWKEIARVVRRSNGAFETADGQPFTAGFDSGGRYGRLTISPHGESSITILESSMAELWTMLSAARLALPSQFPGGLEPAAPYLTAVLGKTDTVRAVRAAIGDGVPAHSLLYLPPPDAAAPVSGQLAEAS